MKIYLAARYTRRVELCSYANDLRDLGHEITSRWLNGLHETPSNRGLGPVDPHDSSPWALEDLEDVRAADCVVSFTEPARVEAGRGGRHVEYGFALGLGKRCIVVGHYENVFHCLPGIEFFETWPEAYEAVAVPHSDDLVDALHDWIHKGPATG